MLALIRKSEAALATRFTPPQAERIKNACSSQARLEAMPVDTFIDLWVL